MAGEYNGPRASMPTNPILDEIMTALTEPDIMILGVYGSRRNARERDVVEQITRRVYREGVFSVIMKANVVEKNIGCWCWSRLSPDMRRKQEELGNKLDPKLLDKTTDLNERASRLCDRIKMEANILIILDDVRGEINLAKIGIPFGNEHNGCKILLVAESEEVLVQPNECPTKNNIPLGSLDAGRLKNC